MSRATTGDFGKGRGETAVADMKARLDAMRNSGLSGDKILDTLWARNHEAIHGDGHNYEYAEAQ